MLYWLVKKDKPTKSRSLAIPKMGTLNWFQKKQKPNKMALKILSRGILVLTVT